MGKNKDKKKKDKKNKNKNKGKALEASTTASETPDVKGPDTSSAA
jgi:hypothetical protein